MSEEPIYLDHHAATPVDPRVLQAMLPYFTEHFGNAASVSHAFGWSAKEAVDRARAEIAAAIGASPREIVFTSGATESNNLAIRGTFDRLRKRGNHFVSVATEHKAVLDPLARLARRGAEVTLLDVASHDSNQAGLLDLDRFRGSLREETCLVSVMFANNEIGAIQPIAEIARICREKGIPVHCDAVQAVGRLPIDVARLDLDFLSFTAHKLYGPKGIGALYVRRKPPQARLEAQIEGGGHETGLRSGTLNVPGIVGFAKALTLCCEEMSTEADRLAVLRARLFSRLREALPDAALNGPAFTGEHASGTPLRLPHNLNVTFGNVDGEALMMSMRTIAVSSGAACTSNNPEPSHVLRALGLSDDLVRSSLRFGLGRSTTAAHIEIAAEAVIEAVTRLRRLGGK